MKLHQLNESKELILKTEQRPNYNRGKTLHTVDPSVVVYRNTLKSIPDRSSNEWTLSDVGNKLVEQGKLKEADGITWTIKDNVHSGIITLQTKHGTLHPTTRKYVYVPPYYRIAHHDSTKDSTASSRKSDQHLQDILDGLAYGNQDPKFIEYIKQHYPEAITNQIAMYRVFEISVKELYKRKIKTADDVEHLITSFKPGQYVSWSTKKEGIDYFRDTNMGSQTSNVPGWVIAKHRNNNNHSSERDAADNHYMQQGSEFYSKSRINEFPILFVMKQQSRAIDIVKLLDIVKNSEDSVQSYAWISRASQMGEAHEVLAPITPTAEVMSIQAPYITDEGRSKVIQLKPDEISTVYDMRRKLKNNGHWAPSNKNSITDDRWDTSMIPESFKQYLFML